MNIPGWLHDSPRLPLLSSSFKLQVRDYQLEFASSAQPQNGKRAGTICTLVLLSTSPTKVETSRDPGMAALVLKSFGMPGKGDTGGSSGRVTVYEFRMLKADPPSLSFPWASSKPHRRQRWAKAARRLKLAGRQKCSLSTSLALPAGAAKKQGFWDSACSLPTPPRS